MISARKTGPNYFLDFFSEIGFLAKNYQNSQKRENAQNCTKFYFHKYFFRIIRGKRGMGERRHEIDAYLLDNRNRTQKWDE